MAGTSFIAGPQNNGIQGCSRDILYCRLLRTGNQSLVKNFLVSIKWSGYSHHLPAVEGRSLGRRDEGGERLLARL